MRKGAVALTAMAAVAFLLGSYLALTGHHLFGRVLHAWQPGTYIRGTITLLLFAVVFLLLERGRTER